MKNESILKELAPCGIDCSRCASFKESEIATLSQSLAIALTGFEKMAERTKAFTPAFNHYNEFLQVLNHLASPTCDGCRSGKSVNCHCIAKDCAPTQGVDFCFECSSYPCDKYDLSSPLALKWKANNDAMKKQGLDNFYHSQKGASRY